MSRTNFIAAVPLGLLLLAPTDPLTAETTTRDRMRRPLTLLFDDYYQLPRPDSFPQGAPLHAEERRLSNSYLPGANAIPNGTFVFSRLIAHDYDVRLSQAPISAKLLQATDAYMMVCPISPEKGGRAAITEKEAELLESFVADGGILVLVANSVASSNVSSFDLPGINLIAQRFGLRFAAKTTTTLLIPIPRDNPIFSGPKNLIYGNGTIIEHGDAPARGTTVLLASCNPEVTGAVAVRVRYKRGTVLALGDAGTLGNAHALRSESDQADAIRQMMQSLLPDGPLPAYRWSSGLRMRVKLFHQQIVTGYPDELRLLDLPMDPRVNFVESSMRELDRQSANPGVQPAKVTRERGFASVIAEWSAVATLSIGKFDGRAFDSLWSDEHGQGIPCRVTPRGEIIDTRPEPSALTPWRWALTNAAILSPLNPSARVGEEWTRKLMTPLPQAQLPQVPRMREVQGTVKFEGIEEYKGRQCFVLSQTVELSPLEMKPQDLVNPDYEDYFNQRNIRFTSSGQLAYVKAWIDQASLLPVKTELRSSSSFWWADDDQPDLFLSNHDAKRIYENVRATRHIATFGRLLTAEFEIE